MLLAAILSVTATAQNSSEELRLADRLIEVLERENSALKTRLDTERSANSILKELNETRKSETEALRQTVAAKNETIAAKDAVITAQDKLIAGLKTSRPSIWKRLGDIAIGAAAGAILR